jgi:hypothetical protein
MKARKVSENRDVLTIEEAVNYAIGAAQEAYDEVKRQPNQTEYAATNAARLAYRNCMPLMETKASAKCFIAAVAQGVNLEFITAEEAKLMLYGVQIWMQVEAGKPAEVLQ